MDPRISNEMLQSTTPPSLTRRGFLASAAALALKPSAAWGLSQDPASPQSPPSQQVTTPARVVQVESDGVWFQGQIHPTRIRDMVTAGLTGLTQTSSESEAWKAVLGAAKRVMFKFNRSGAQKLRTQPALASALAASLAKSGIDGLVCCAKELLTPFADFLPVEDLSSPWTEDEIDFGSGRDRFHVALESIDALINVTFLKHHNIAGLTCSLKNLSHGLIQHPARYHADGCSPFIADIVAHPLIRTRVRLNIVDAVRIVVDQGPEPSEENLDDLQSLIFGLDPVALDTVCLGILNRARVQRGLSRIGGPKDGLPPSLAEAARRGLGEAVLHRIDWQRVRV